MPSLPAGPFRLFALVGPIRDQQQQIHARQSAGRSREFMPFPQVVLAEGDEHGCTLYRYRGDRTFCGDTWHQSLEDAQAQCTNEYGQAIGEWLPVPPSAPHAHEFAIASVGVQPEA